jgi:F0F1-type ATP synthase delta subunit
MNDSKVLAQTLMKISNSENADIKISGFFDYLREKNLMGLLPQIKYHIHREGNKTSAENTLIISIKHDISDSEIDDIKSLVGADMSVSVEIIKEPSMVGGFSAIYQGNIYDGSLRNQLTQMRTRLTH